MASVSSKTDQIVDEKLEEKKEVDDIKLDGEENTVTLNISEEKPESEDFSNVEGLEKSGKIKDSETVEKIDVDLNLPTSVEVNVKDLEVETGMPEEEKKEVPDVSEAPENDDLNVPTSIEVSVNDLEVQSAFPEEEQKEEKTTKTQEPSSIDSGSEEVVQSSSHEEKASEDAEDITQVSQNSTDLSAAEVFSDQGRAPEAVEIVEEEKDTRFNIEKKAIEETVKDLHIVPEASDQEAEAPKDFITVEESIEQVIEENKNESSKEAPAETSNDLETPELAAEVVKDIGSSEMVGEKKNYSEDNSLVERNVQITDDKKEETQLEEAIQIATDKSEKKELGAEKEESEKSKADIKSTKRESNNLFSKVKRSIVKAKKAILGKSPGPKTLSSETKDDNS